MKALVILNLSAGKGASDSVREKIERQFAAANIDYEVVETGKDAKPGDVVRERMDEKFDLVVAAGGDGTVSEVFDALFGSSVPLGIVPTGTGNWIARELNIPTQIDDAIALIVHEPRTMVIDAMRIGKRVYVLNAGVGINAVVAATPRESKKRFGLFAYVVTVFKTIRIRPRQLEVTADGTTHTFRAVEVAISNCGILAKKVYPNGPDIRVDDGHVDIWILSMKTMLDYTRYLIGLLFGRRTKAQFLIARQRVTITSKFPLIAQADGDVIGTTPIEAEILPGALRVLVPTQS
ncbi:MAG TPA: diacylglycerol kinase family protein [Candidatus Krumholzibacteria bacterium]|nr:diacylglycerol kinase family protein [Candidatus Krumholzibacteria bacterium]